MRAGLRWKTVLLAGGLWLVAPAAHAQDAPPATTNTPATDAIGPKELQNFSLRGTTTRPAEQPAAPPAASPPAARSDTPAAEVSTRAAQQPRAAPIRQASRESAVVAPPPASAEAPPASAASQLPPPTQAPATATAQPVFSPAAAPPPVEPTGTLAPEHKLSLLPWLAAALALAGAGIFLLWRRRPRQAFAGHGVGFDVFAAPEPAPAPRPAPAPPAAAQPRPAPPASTPVPAPPAKPTAPVASGIVASRLRPSLEIAVVPLRCLIEDSQVAIEFELDLFNAGTAPARAVLAEASIFNVGPNQEQELAAFFARPVGAGNRIDAIPPLRRLTFTSRVVAPREAIQEYELAGRKSFVPVIAFNALYEWSGSSGQTSAAFLVGRDTGGEKLGPLRLDLGPRDVRGLGARVLPTGLKA
jgi:hypothetical protein